MSAAVAAPMVGRPLRRPRWATPPGHVKDRERRAAKRAERRHLSDPRERMHR